MSTVATRRERGGAEPRLRTIGSVCEELREQFPDISVSKIRYLEDQGLISPRRTRGGYRLFAPDDIERLTTILKLQRDEFLPLRVIREELDGPGASNDRTRRRSVGVLGHEDEIDEAELCERAAVSHDLVRQLEEFGLLVSRSAGGERLYGESEADIAAACARLARYGVDARHLRTFVTGARAARPRSSSSSSRPAFELEIRNAARMRSTTSRPSRGSHRSFRTCSSSASCAATVERTG